MVSCRTDSVYNIYSIKVRCVLLSKYGRLCIRIALYVRSAVSYVVKEYKIKTVENGIMYKLGEYDCVFDRWLYISLV